MDSPMLSVRIKLEQSGFDGLYVPGECACLLDDLAPCGSVQADRDGWINGCVPGHRHNDPRPGHEHEWVLMGSKEAPSAEDFERMVF